jgi:hypothetical protein
MYDQPQLLSNDIKVKYQIPLKVSEKQYIECLSHEMKGTCRGSKIRGEYYITLLNPRWKFMVELIVNNKELL